MNNLPFKKILIIGLGVMGGSYLRTLAKFNSELYVIEKDETTLKKAHSLGIEFSLIDINSEKLKEMDLVLITLYPTQIIEYFELLNNKISNDALVCEISGIKTKIATSLRQLKLNYNYLLVHPMAGKESAGFDFSSDTIYTNANHIIIDDVKSCDEMLENKYLEFNEKIGFNPAIKMSVYNHDQAITYTSQLSHILAVALLNSKDYQPYTRKTIGDSFRDLTRIAKMNTDLWPILFLNNQKNLENSIDNLIEQLTTIKELFNDKTEFVKYLEKAKDKRSEFENDR